MRKRVVLVQAVAAFLSLNVQEFAAVAHLQLSLEVGCAFGYGFHPACQDASACMSLREL